MLLLWFLGAIIFIQSCLASTVGDSNVDYEDLLNTLSDHSREINRVLKVIVTIASDPYDNRIEMEDLYQLLNSTEDSFRTFRAKFSDLLLNKLLEVDSAQEGLVYSNTLSEEDSNSEESTFTASEESTFTDVSSDEDESKVLKDRVGYMRDFRWNPSSIPTRGIAGVDYPDYQELPHTSFTCDDKEHFPGIYADIESRCQAFHVCWEDRIESFLCPAGSTFNQEILSCDNWFNSTCSTSPDYYDVNLQPSLKFSIYCGSPGEDVNSLSFLLGLSGRDDMLYAPYLIRTEYFPDVEPDYDYRRRLKRDIDHVAGDIYNKFYDSLSGSLDKVTQSSEGGESAEYSSQDLRERFGHLLQYPEDYSSPEHSSHQEFSAPLDDLLEHPDYDDQGDHLSHEFGDSLDDLLDHPDDSPEYLSHGSPVEDLHHSEESSREYSLHKVRTTGRNFYHNFKMDRIGGAVEEAEDNNKTKTPENEQTPAAGSETEISESKIKSKDSKKVVAPVIVSKVLASSERTVNKGILPLTKEILAASYGRFMKTKKY